MQFNGFSLKENRNIIRCEKFLNTKLIQSPIKQKKKTVIDEKFTEKLEQR